MSELGEILDGEPVAEAETPEVETPEAVTEAPVVEPEKPEEPKAEEHPHTVPVAALQKEREKSQALGERLARIEGMLAAPAQVKEPVTRPDPIEDPEGAASYDMQVLHVRDLNRSQRIAERDHGKDFVQEAFEAAKAAGKASEFGQSQFGWEDMADWHKANVEAQKANEALSEIGDPVAYRDKIRAEILREVQAEQVAKTMSAKAPSLAGETSLAARTGPAYSPPSLDAIIGEGG